MVEGLDGDAAGYKALLSKLSRHLRAYFRGRLARMGRSVVEAEELMQETLIGLHTRRHTYDPSHRSRPGPTRSPAISFWTICGARKLRSTTCRLKMRKS